jgi:hypothetical protein
MLPIFSGQNGNPGLSGAANSAAREEAKCYVTSVKIAAADQLLWATAEKR